MLALGDGPALLIHPCESIVAISGADVDHHSRVRLRASGTCSLVRHGGKTLGGKDHVFHVFDCFLERRVDVAGVLPDLVGERGEVHFVVFGVIQNVGFLGEQVTDDRVVLFVLEEGLIGANDLRVFFKALADASTQADEAFDAIRRQERVTEDLL